MDQYAGIYMALYISLSLLEQIKGGGDSDTAPRLCGAVAQATIQFSGSNDKRIQITLSLKSIKFRSRNSRAIAPLFTDLAMLNARLVIDWPPGFSR